MKLLPTLLASTSASSCGLDARVDPIKNVQKRLEKLEEWGEDCATRLMPTV